MREGRENRKKRTLWFIGLIVENLIRQGGRKKEKEEGRLVSVVKDLKEIHSKRKGRG